MNQNLFELDLILPGQVMSIRIKAMTITGRDRLTHFVSQNKQIPIWYRQLAYINNA